MDFRVNIHMWIVSLSSHPHHDHSAHNPSHNSAVSSIRVGVEEPRAICVVRFHATCTIHDDNIDHNDSYSSVFLGPLVMLSHQTENYTNTHYHRHDRYDHDGDLFDHNDSLLLDSDGPLCDLRQKHETFLNTLTPDQYDSRLSHYPGRVIKNTLHDFVGLVFGP